MTHFQKMKPVHFRFLHCDVQKSPSSAGSYFRRRHFFAYFVFRAFALFLLVWRRTHSEFVIRLVWFLRSYIVSWPRYPGCQPDATPPKHIATGSCCGSVITLAKAENIPTTELSPPQTITHAHDCKGTQPKAAENPKGVLCNT